MTAPQSEAKTSGSPLLAGCSIVINPAPYYVSGWNMGQTKKSKYTSNTFSPKMVSVILLIVLIMLMYVQVLIFQISLVLISFI